MDDDKNKGMTEADKLVAAAWEQPLPEIVLKPHERPMLEMLGSLAVSFQLSDDEFLESIEHVHTFLSKRLREERAKRKEWKRDTRGI